MKPFDISVISFLLFQAGCSDFCRAQSVYPGQHSGKLKVEASAPMKAYSFDLKDVKLLPSVFTENMERTSAWLLSIETDRLLHSFRTSAGVYAGREGGYFTKKLGGWESLDCELRGHTTGHILSALSYLYASTGEEVYKLKSDSIVNGLAEVQSVLSDNGHNGYLSAYPENLINRNLKGESVWAPWYTLHKIYSGLIDQYLYCGSEKALEVVNGMASWAYDKLSSIGEEQRRLLLRNEFGGISESFYNLYSITADSRYKWLAEFFYHNDMLDPLAEGEDNLAGKHANTFIPKVIAESRNYELHNCTKAKHISDFFWNTVIDHQTYCTGGNSDKEKFIDSDQISKRLTGYTQETCNTNNMLKLTRHLFCQEASAKYADYYERALYNHILGQQDPESGMVAYFLPLLAGSHKVYSTPDHSFWCCVGTGFENHSKYGEAIYYNDGTGLYVNLFIPSELNWKEKGVKVRQETLFPEDEYVKLTISATSPVEMPVYLRYPEWSSNVQVKINGQSVKIRQKSSTYIALNRVWKDGDVIEVTYPMNLYLVEANDEPNKAALAYGPLILAGVMGTKGMQSPAPFSDPEIYNDYYIYDYHIPADIPVGLNINKKKMEDTIIPVSGKKLTFKATKDDITLEPIYKVHRQRYVVYWELIN